MADPTTIEVYQRQGREWTSARRPRDGDQVAWVEAERAAGPVVDIGCGPGWNLAGLAPPRIALDAAPAMLDQVDEHAPGSLPVLASADALPFATGSLGGALANRVLVHLPHRSIPTALADLHRVLALHGPAFVRVFGDEEGRETRDTGRFEGRLYSGWGPGEFEDLCIGAGFTIERTEGTEGTEGTGSDGSPSSLRLRLKRALTLADTVGPGMRLLICGLNPSLYSAEAGVGFARPGNRFWPAARQAGIVTVDRNPRLALEVDGVGMTDLAKRATRRADELSVEEYEEGLGRVERLTQRLQPDAICFVGLAGWRAAVDRRATAGIQSRPLGGRPVYLMPSTSGLNAHATPADLTDHLRQAAHLADGN